MNQIAWSRPTVPQQFYGVDGNNFKLGTQVFEAIEDACDGYRSLLDTIEVRKLKPHGTPILIFAREPLDTVTVMKATSDMNPTQELYKFTGYYLTASDGHVWLTVGTNYLEDYYPCFTFRYTPRTGDAS